VKRREFLRLAAALASGAVLGASPWDRALARATATSGESPFGPLQGPDQNGIMLPAGFRSRVIAVSNEPVAPSAYLWHLLPDGGATFRSRGGWLYVSNSELFSHQGGASAIRFDERGRILDAYSICSGTDMNCAGGATPWGTWLSCEETPAGRVWECDPEGERAQVVRPALGTFKHEAVAVDPVRRCLYLTEDVPDGAFYRFAPGAWADLSSGTLEVAAVAAGGEVTWHAVPEPDPADPEANPTRHQVPEVTPFDGGEGIAYDRDHVYFSTKGDDRVWDYDVVASKLSVLYDAALEPDPVLTGVDNVAVSRAGDLLVAEDGGNMELVLITAQRAVSPLLRIVGQDGSEITGPAFDPWGRRLYLSSQRGAGAGITYEVTGPFRHFVSL
jgi:secreted PhoX family phosphatase